MNLTELIKDAVAEDMTIARLNFYRDGGGVGQAETVAELFDVLRTETFDSVRAWFKSANGNVGHYHDFDFAAIATPGTTLTANNDAGGVARGGSGINDASAARCRNCGRSPAEHGPQGCPVDWAGRPNPAIVPDGTPPPWLSALTAEPVPSETIARDCNARADRDGLKCYAVADGCTIDIVPVVTVDVNQKKTDTKTRLLSFNRADFDTLSDREFADMVYLQMKGVGDGTKPVDTDRPVDVPTLVRKLNARLIDADFLVRVREEPTGFLALTDGTDNVVSRYKVDDRLSTDDAETHAMEKIHRLEADLRSPAKTVQSVDESLSWPKRKLTELSVREYFIGCVLTGLISRGSETNVAERAAILADRVIADLKIDV